MLHGERPLLGTVEKDFVSAAENHIALRPSLGDVTFLPFKALMEKCWEPDALGRLTAADAVCPQFACSSPPCVACWFAASVACDAIKCDGACDTMA